MNNTTLSVETFTAPSSWASYFLNGDSSGMDEAEIAHADHFIDWVGTGSPVSCEDAGFIARPDSYSVYPYAADCQTYTFLSASKQPMSDKINNIIDTVKTTPGEPYLWLQDDVGDCILWPSEEASKGDNGANAIARWHLTKEEVEELNNSEVWIDEHN